MDSTKRAVEILVAILIGAFLAAALTLYAKHARAEGLKAYCKDGYCIMRAEDLLRVKKSLDHCAAKTDYKEISMALCDGGKLRSIGNQAGQTLGYGFECPGCGSMHVVYTEPAAAPHPIWGFNGNVRAPTFTPSLLVSWEDHSVQPPVRHVCHSYITDGKIQFLGDSTHALAGQTVEIPQWETDAP